MPRLLQAYQLYRSLLGEAVPLTERQAKVESLKLQCYTAWQLKAASGQLLVALFANHQLPPHTPTISIYALCHNSANHCPAGFITQQLTG
jgi:hypothetical protein